MSVNAQYNVAAPQSLPVRLAGYQRRRMYERFLQASEIAPDERLLDVGVTSDRSYEHSNYVPAWYPHKNRITAVGIDDAAFLEQEHPGLTFQRADGRALPFGDKSFDHVHSSAVLEHVGSRAQQTQFLRELWRVAAKSIFVTTPNKWFPVEFHTVLPLVHWLPPEMFRATLRKLGRSFFADENNLNLLDGGALAAIAADAGISRFRVQSVTLGGWPSNLLLVAHRD